MVNFTDRYANQIQEHIYWLSDKFFRMMLEKSFSFIAQDNEKL